MLLLIALFLGNSVHAQVLLSESFDGATFPPTGWTVNGTGVSTNPNTPTQIEWTRDPGGVTTAYAPYTNAAGPHTGAGMAFYNAWDISAGGVSNLITPALNFASPSGTKVISFWLYRNNAQVANDSVVVLINSTASVTGATRLFGVAPSEGAPSSLWQQYTVNVPASFNGASQYIIFQAQSAYQTDIFLDDVSINNLLACSGAPTSLVLSASVTSTCPATPFTLTANPGMLSGYTYQFESSTNGGVTWSNLGTASTNATYTVTNQTAATQYRVTATCTSGGGSTTSTPVSVGQNAQSSCYCIPSSTSTTYYIDNFSTTGGILNISNLASGQSSNGYGQFLAQTVSQTPLQSVGFNASFGGSGSTYGFTIWVDWNQNGNFSDPGEKVFSSTSYNATYNGTFMVPATALSGPTRMRITADYLNSSPNAPCQTTSAYAEYEDYTFNVIALTACSGTVSAAIASSITAACPNVPFTLTATPNTLSGVTYQFQANTGSGWTNLGTASVNPSRTVTTQTVATQYRVYITCSAGGTDTSAGVAVAQNPPNQCYCTPSSASTFYYIDNFSTTGGLTNVSNLGSGQSVNGYGQFLSQVVSQNPTFPVSFSTSFGGSGSTYGFTIWVDWNQNGSFSDPGEKVFTSSSYNASYTGTFTVPATAAAGTTRMRITADYLNTSPNDPCQTTSAYAEYEDYTFNVIPLTPCTGTPSATIASSISSACPNLPFSLTASPLGQSGLTYQFQSSTNGGASWNNMGAASASPSYTIATQTVATQYRVYITCNAGGTDTSAPVSVAQTPATGCYCIPSGSTSGYYINNFVTTGGITNISNLGTGYQPGGYGQFLSQNVTQFPGQTVSFTADFGAGSNTFGFAIWVDWNQNGSLTDPGEKVYSSTNYSTSHSGTFTVPATALSGPTRMRIGNSYTPSTGPASPCSTGISGEFEDYTFQVVPLVPCSGPPNIGALVSNILVPCVGDSITISMPNATFDTGILFRWEYRDATTGGLWASGNPGSIRTFGHRPTSNTEYRVVARCTLTNDSTTSAILTINPLAPTLPYFEDFESITANNQLPACMKATALGTINLTYLSRQGVSRKNHTPGGDKYGAFKYNTTAEEYFFTPGLAMQAGLTYKISYWYVTDGQGGNNGNVVSTRTTIGTTPTVAGVTATLGQVTNPTDTNYQQAVYYYTPAQNGTYFVGFGNIATTTNAYFSIDDIGVEALPPCTGMPVAGTVVSNTPVNCPGLQVQLSTVGSTAASYLTYRWYDINGPIAGIAATMPTYLTAPLTTAVNTYQLEITCANPNTGVQSAITAPFTITPYTVTVPYLETFESITRNNDVPSCFTTTDLAIGTFTYASGGPGSNHTPGGAKYAAFKSTTGGPQDEWMFTPMMNMQLGKTYRFNFWYRTSGGSFPALQPAVATGPSAQQVIAPLTAIYNAGTSTYQEYIATYTPTATGDYSFGIYAQTSSSNTNAMSIDDIGVIELPPCTGMPSVTISPAGPINLCPTDSFTMTAPLPSFSGLVYEWQYSADSNFQIGVFPAGSTTTSIRLAAPLIPRYYRLRVICTSNTPNDTAYSNRVFANVNVTQYAPLPYLNNLENWVNNCSNHDVPTGNNWLQLVRTGNSSWRRNDEGATAGWTSPNSGAYTPPARSGLYSARFHSSQAAVTTANGGADEGKLDMYLNCNTGPGTSPNKALYFYHISPGTPTNALDVRLSIDGGSTWSTLSTYDSAFDWRLRRLPFVSNSGATIIRFAGRHTSATAGSDIGIDSIFVAPPCNAQPVAGTIGAVTPTQICPGDSAILNLTGTSMAGDLRIDWETSVVGPGGPWTSRTAGPNGGGYSFNSGQLMQTTWIRARVTCNGSTLSDTSNAIAFTVSVTPATAYAPLPYTQNFENWTDRCGLKEIPSANWSNVPSFGNTSWRRNDQGATGAWSNIMAGQWWPGTPAAAIDSFSARFHNAAATPDGSRGALNLYVDCSNTTGDKELRFFVNMSDRTAGNTDSLRIRYSIDGGFTFTRLDSIRRTNGWQQRIYVLPSNSARTIIRFEAVSQSSQKDIGIDYVQVLEPCAGTTVAGTVDSVQKVCPGRSFRLSTTGTSLQGGLTYVWESSASGQPGSFTAQPGGTLPFYTTSINQNTWFRLGVSCGPGGTVVYTPARLVELNDTFHCYCVTNPQYPFVTAQYKENIGKVALKNNAGINMMTNGFGSPINNNNTAVNAYSNFQNLPATPLYRDSTYKLEVQQISYSSNAPAKVVAWIDFNRDGVFDATERIVNLNTSGSTAPAFNILGSFTVPSNATPGITGMRITLQQPGSTTPPDPCGLYNGNGETEDYMVELRFAPCSGFATLGTGTASISDTMICPGYPVTLWDTGYQQQVYGVTRQWQQSTNNGLSWQNVGTPNTDTINAIVLGATQYRFSLMCNNGVASYSNTVSVGILPSTVCYCPSYATGGPNGDKDSSDIGSVSLNNFTFQVGGPHLLNPMATRKWTNYAASGGVIELWADSTYDMDIYHIMRGSVHKDAKVTVFIDYNQNLAFDMNPQPGYPSERVLTAYTTANNYYLDNLQLRIPSQQVLPNGATLMRVILNEDTGPNAASDQGCGTYVSGETEDYYVVFRCPSCPTGVQNPDGDNIRMFSLFPNPTTGMAKVSLSTGRAVKEIELTITNMTGQVMKKETFSQPGTQFSTTVDLKEQPRGVYFVEIKADNERIVRKLVVQ